MQTRGFWSWAGVLAVVACGGDDDGAPAPATGCTPGESQACTGPGGCEGGQICGEDGATFGECDCSSAGASDPSGGDGGASAAGNAGGQGAESTTGGTSPTTGGAAGSSGSSAAGSAGAPQSAGAGGDGGMAGAAQGGAGGAGGAGQAGAAGAAGQGQGGAPPGDCAGGSSVSTCGNGVADPGEICYGLPEFVAFDDDLDVTYRDIAVADIDGNGQVEVLVLASYSDTLRLHQVSTGPGGFVAAPAVTIATNLYTAGGALAFLGVGEVTGDGYLDVVTRYLNSGFGGTEVVTPGTSTGAIGTPGSATSAGMGPLRFGRADGDALDDLFLISSSLVARDPWPHSAP